MWFIADWRSKCAIHLFQIEICSPRKSRTPFAPANCRSRVSSRLACSSRCSAPNSARCGKPLRAGSPMMAASGRRTRPLTVLHQFARRCDRRNWCTVAAIPRCRNTSLTLPDGQITSSSARGPVQPLSQKYSDFPKPKSGVWISPSRPMRGAFRDRHERGPGCGGRGCAFDERRVMRTAKPCGPDTPMLVSSS